MTGYDIAYIRALVDGGWDIPLAVDRREYCEKEATRLYLEDPTHWDKVAQLISANIIKS